MEAVVRQLPLEIAPRGGLRLGEQQRGCHASKLATRFSGVERCPFERLLRRSFPTWLDLGSCRRLLGSARRPAPWQSHPPLPEPRTEVAAAVARGEIVVVGGFTADGGNSARVDAYSIAGNRWRRLPDLPVAVDHAAAASANGRVYVVGGYGRDRAPLDAAFVLENGAWRRLAPLPDARAAAAAAIAGGKLYVLGGVDGRRSLARVAFALDLRTGRWARLPGPAPREHLAAAAAGHPRLRARRPQRRHRHEHGPLRAYDPRTRRWTRLAPVPQARGGTGAALVNGADRLGRRRAAAGHDPFRLRVRVAHERWRRLADLPSPRHGLGVVGARRAGSTRRGRPAARAHRQRRGRSLAVR